MEAEALGTNTKTKQIASALSGFIGPRVPSFAAEGLRLCRDVAGAPPIKDAGGGEPRLWYSQGPRRHAAAAR